MAYFAGLLTGVAISGFYLLGEVFYEAHKMKQRKNGEPINERKRYSDTD